MPSAMAAASLLDIISFVPKRSLTPSSLTRIPLFRPNIPWSSKLSRISCGCRSPAPPQEDRHALDTVINAFLDKLKSLRRPVIAAVLLGILIVGDPYTALVASGGRMGGRVFSSSSSSRSYSAQSASRGFSYSAPFYAPSPFSGGFFVGPAFGVGVGAGSGFFLLMMGFAAVVLLSGFLSDRADDSSVVTAAQKTSVLKLQVGLLGIARSFRKDLDQIAETADTSTPVG